MRRVFLLIHSPTPSPEFPLKGYASGSRRFDVVARVVLAAFHTGKGVRSDTELYVYLSDSGKTLTLRPSSFRGVEPREAEVLSTLRDMLKDASILDFSQLLDRVVPRNYVRLYLTEKGSSVGEVLGEICRAPGVVVALGGKEDVPPDIERVLDSTGFLAVSIGPRSYLSSHCVAFIHMVLDGCGS